MSGGRLPIADHPAALTADWLSAALGEAGVLDGARVADVDLSPIGTGQMCDSVRLSLRYDAPTSAPDTVVAKLPAADETSRSTAVMLRNYEKEVRFYQEVAPTLAVRTPSVLHAAIDDTLSSFVLLLEDLSPAQVGDQIEGCSVDEARRALSELARLHAPRWGDPALEELTWLGGRGSGVGGAGSDERPADAGVSQMLPLLWAGFQERYAEQITPLVQWAGDELFGNLVAYVTPPATPRTVTHGDFRLDNLLFHPTSEEVAVVDWQTCGLGIGPTDAAYFVGAGLRTDDRRAHEEDLVRTYHQQLRSLGVEGYDWDACWTDYRRGCWSGVLMAVAAAMLVERTERGDRMFLTMAERHAAQADDLSAAELLHG